MLEFPTHLEPRSGPMDDSAPPNGLEASLFIEVAQLIVRDEQSPHVGRPRDPFRTPGRFEPRDVLLEECEPDLLPAVLRHDADRVNTDRGATCDVLVHGGVVICRVGRQGPCDEAHEFPSRIRL